MEYNFDTISEESFFSQEVIAVLLRVMGNHWRPALNYNNLPPRLQPISEFIMPVVNGVLALSRHYQQIIVQHFELIHSILLNTPTEQIFVCVLQSLYDVAMTVLAGGDQERSTFAFIALTAAFCGWFLNTDQSELITAAYSVLSFVLTMELPGGFIPTLERLRDYEVELDN